MWMKTKILRIFMVACIAGCLAIVSSCTKKLEDSSARMAETSTALQQSTQVQMQHLLLLMDRLTSSIGSLEQNFFSLIIVMQQMQIDLNELAKVSEPVRTMIIEMNKTFEKLFQKSETPNRETEDLSDILGEGV